MEDQIGQPPKPSDRTRVRVRVKRKLSRWERLVKVLEMPRLKRRDRNQRLAIGGVVLALLFYIAVIRPFIQWITPISKPKQTQLPARPAPRR